MKRHFSSNIFFNVGIKNIYFWTIMLTESSLTKAVHKMLLKLTVECVSFTVLTLIPSLPPCVNFINILHARFRTKFWHQNYKAVFWV